MQILRGGRVLKYKRFPSLKNYDYVSSLGNVILYRSKITKQVVLVGGFYLALSTSTNATPINSTKIDSVCDAAARDAAEETGVPLDVLMAITRTETGRTINGTTQPWPWTVNMEGRGDWFDTKAEALSYVFDHFKSGARSFDIGCFQINYRWHGSYFASIEEMFNPLSNARYAASFLRTLFDESGNWTVAAGAFHSRTAVHADRYMVRFGSMLAEVDLQDIAESAQRSPSSRDHRINNFPLILQGNPVGLASLVPLSTEEGVRPMIDLTTDGGI